LPYVDLLVFGFPCQAFSMAGKRKGFDDTRGTLFYDALRYLQEHKPRYFIAENVKGLLSHDNRKTFQTIIDCLAKTTNYQMSLMPFDNLGYHIHYKVLNTKDFGIPQNRERIFIIGIRDDEDNNFKFPKEIPLELKLKDILQDNPTYARAGLYQPYPRNYKELGLERKEQLEERKDEVSNCLTTSNEQEIIVDEKYYLSDKAIAKIKRHNNTSVKNELSNCIHAGYYKQGGRDQQYIKGIEYQNRIRRLTPIECERLQGFPDNFTEGVSDTQRYKQMGNTITVNVIQEIIKNLI
jgi:DNA (cytosine-5)-methyltransferase 1